MEPEYCNWCGTPIPSERKDRNFCSEECVRKDYRDWKATEQDKWSRYNEV